MRRIGCVAFATALIGVEVLAGVAVKAGSTVAVSGGIPAQVVDAPSAAFVALPTTRIMDSRPGHATVDGLDAGGGVIEGGAILQLRVAGRGGVPGHSVVAALTVTVIEPNHDGFVTVFTCGPYGTVPPPPLISTSNFRSGMTASNTVLAQIGFAQFPHFSYELDRACIYVSETSHLVVDVSGYMPINLINGQHYVTQPRRVLDTRAGEPTFDGQQQDLGARSGGSVTEVVTRGRGEVPVDLAPANARAVALSVTVTQPTAAGFVVVRACGAPRPPTSHLNYAEGQTVANLVIAAVGDSGNMCVYTSAAMHLIVDFYGYFTAGSTYTSIAPDRLLDTRAGDPTDDVETSSAGLVPGGTVTPVHAVGRGGVPAEVEAVAVNVAVVEPSNSGFLTVFACGTDVPLASAVNFVASQTVANLFLVEPGTAGSICVYNSAPSHLIVDIEGYLALDV